VESPIISAIEDTTRVGIEIRRDENFSWRETLVRYARLRNLVSECTAMYDGLIEAGMAEPWAALKALDHHGCTDVILDQQHLDANIINNFN